MAPLVGCAAARPHYNRVSHPRRLKGGKETLASACTNSSYAQMVTLPNSSFYPLQVEYLLPRRECKFPSMPFDHFDEIHEVIKVVLRSSSNYLPLVKLRKIVVSNTKLAAAMYATDNGSVDGLSFESWVKVDQAFMDGRKQANEVRPDKKCGII